MSEHEFYSHLTQEEKHQKLYGHQVYTGFPNQANDTLRADLDFNAYLVPNKTATFTMKVSGSGLIDANINHGDMIIVDRSKNPANGSLIVAIINNEFTLKIFYQRGQLISLSSRKSGMKPYVVQDEDEFKLWGVVSFIIHDARAKCS